MNVLAFHRQYYCDMEPPACVMEFFQKRGDKQITSLEILSIALGISTFGDLISNRRLIVFSDNKGAEHSTQKGRASQYVACTFWSVGMQLQGWRASSTRPALFTRFG
jgi:hypothetical protein